MLLNTDNIVAIATPTGTGAVSIVRVSGSDIKHLTKGILGFSPKPRYSKFTSFIDSDGSVIDTGIAIYFPAPHSYTGEYVLELQGHGGAVVIDMLLRRLVDLGARIAKPGEFTERAFLNNKLDLTQAEAIADLIASNTEKAVRCAQRSMQGEFSRTIHKLKDFLTELRTYTEAAIDFIDEDIDFLSDGHVLERLGDLLTHIQSVQSTTLQGCLIRDGMTIVIAGRPNAGKSSLLNFLAGKDTAIVTEWEGTTRDVLRESIQIDGMPLHIIDTAGLRKTNDQIEKIGIERTYQEINKADRVLFIVDQRYPTDDRELLDSFPNNVKVTKIFNKIDLTNTEPAIVDTNNGTKIYLSVKNRKGTDLLLNHLKQCVGYEQNVEGVFIARRRHLEALEKAEKYIQNSITSLINNTGCELLAEELRLAQNALSEITGEFTSDDLLGEIFSSFCIGK